MTGASHKSDAAVVTGRQSYNSFRKSVPLRQEQNVPQPRTPPSRRSLKQQETDAVRMRSGSRNVPLAAERGRERPIRKSHGKIRPHKRQRIAHKRVIQEKRNFSSAFLPFLRSRRTIFCTETRPFFGLNPYICTF